MMPRPKGHLGWTSRQHPIDDQICRSSRQSILTVASAKIQLRKMKTEPNRIANHRQNYSENHKQNAPTILNDQCIPRAIPTSKWRCNLATKAISNLLDDTVINEVTICQRNRLLGVHHQMLPTSQSPLRGRLRRHTNKATEMSTVKWSKIQQIPARGSKFKVD
jgi:hypothetical protein